MCVVFKLVLATVALTCASLTSAACNGPTYKRKEFRELIDPSNPSKLTAEGQAFIDGCLCLMNKPSAVTGGQTLWDDFTSSHTSAAGIYHTEKVAPYSTVAAFLPWHRAFLVSAERAMQQCTGNPNTFIPYWDSALDSQSPEASVLWKFLGGNGNAASNWCVTNGPFTSIRPKNPQPHCLQRQFTPSSALASPEALDAMLRQTTYEKFELGIDTLLHIPVHIFVGGQNGDMG